MKASHPRAGAYRLCDSLESSTLPFHKNCRSLGDQDRPSRRRVDIEKRHQTGHQVDSHPTGTRCGFGHDPGHIALKWNTKGMLAEVAHTGPALGTVTMPHWPSVTSPDGDTRDLPSTLDAFLQGRAWGRQIWVTVEYLLGAFYPLGLPSRLSDTCVQCPMSLRHGYPTPSLLAPSSPHNSLSLGLMWDLPVTSHPSS